VVCLPDVADHLTSHPSIRHVTFIGSRDVAHKVAASAARALTPVTVELGGKDPALVLDDAATVKNVDHVISILMRGIFQSAGQNCIGIERVIALPKVHDLILEQVRPLISRLRLGSALLVRPENDVDMGSMISSRSFPRLERLIQDALKQGAVLSTGGHAYSHPEFPNGSYFSPTLLSHVTKDMEIAQTELFAPVFLLVRARDVDEAIEIANSSSYGLGASVFGHDQRSIQKCKKMLQCGMVAVNDFGSYYACSLPFGGMKGSGYGRFGGEEGLRALCNVKAVCEDVWWARMLGIQTSIPGVLRYPVDGARAWEVCKGIVELGYGLEIQQKAGGIVKLMGGLMGLKEETKKA
jgi:acyl-CoA reductase-like NAD-dependent aldehyde dehydrogenase